MRFCLKVLFAAVLLSLSAGTSSARNDVPLCETSTGKPGRLFEKMFGYLSVPTAFDEAKMNEDVGRIAPSVLSELGPLVIPENTGIDVVQFYDQGRVVFACSISVVSFNYGDDDLSSISEGDCGWIASRSLPLLSGLAQHIELPERFNEVAVGDPEIADLSPLTDQSISVRGMTPGVTLVITVDRG
ncbi:MAG: pilus assembly protein N-terminal domain-containing protein, partial [Pseudomonadota bacterium]